MVAHTDAVDTIVHQAALFEMLKQHRPGLIGQSPVFLEGSDPLGWLIALVAGGALLPPPTSWTSLLRSSWIASAVVLTHW